MKNSIGDRIRRLRIENNLTQLELANKVNITPKSISFYELDQRTPGKDILEKLADTLSTTPEYIMYGVASSDLPNDIGTAFDDILELLDDEDSIAFYGDITKLNQEQREILKSAIKHAIDMTNTMVNKENND